MSSAVYFAGDFYFQELLRTIFETNISTVLDVFQQDMDAHV